MIKLNTKFLNEFINENEITNYQKIVEVYNEMLEKKSGQGKDFLGWIDLPTNYNQEEFQRIIKTTQKIKEQSEVLLVIGIGGSYLGAKAVIDLLSHSFANQVNDLEIYFVGQNVSPTYLKEVADMLENKDFSINVISKSGTTTEPAIAFRYFKNILQQKYQEKAAERIYATTDAQTGALKKQAEENNWETFVVPDDVGGRFSVLTAVGLLPISCAGIDINELLLGAQIAQEKYAKNDVKENDAYQYAVIRNILLQKGKNIEILVGYEEKLRYFNEWFKQLYGESEGKDGKGIYPSAAIFSTDLHSLGQYIQEGKRNIFETVINIKKSSLDIQIQEETNDLDELNYLSGKNISYVNQKVFEATTLAHTEGQVPNIIIDVEEITAKNVGELIYFFEKACAMSGYLLGVNPFDQPGVEAYKQKMFELLDKPNK